ncbi:pyridoxal-phosphate dependent enzyme [Kocuria sp. NPDC057446]|uniref:pyridoxal-phosphate dependent enzyme n=1 Tax=Kocuria sp. NPDC057446 TaxID=3346137 RepID=UPI0036890193
MNTWADADPDPPLDFHRRLPGYAITRLVEAPRLATLLGVGSVVVKDETSRFGLPSFKILGASWATYAALRETLGPVPDSDLTPQMLKEWALPARPLTLVAATDGNHGRAVARVANWFGLEARIFVPPFVSETRRRAIIDEGAELVVVDGNYDAAVDAALEDGGMQGRLLISDTARSASDAVPQMVSAGYTTAFLEVEAQLCADDREDLDAIGIQAGVGGLAAAATVWARRPHSGRRANVVVAEPEDAASVFAAVASGQPQTVAATTPTAMAVLQCGTVSLTAFPLLAAGVSCCVALEDKWSLAAVAEMGSCGVDTGPSGAAGLAGLMAGLRGAFAGPVREHLDLGTRSRVLCVATEAAAASAFSSDELIL